MIGNSRWNRRRSFAFFAVIGLTSTNSIVLAQNSDAHGDHSQHEAQPVAEVSDTDHSLHSTEATADTRSTEIDHADHQPVMNHAEIDMDMDMGIAAPAMRDPHSYSGGYTRELGPFALPADEQLTLADEMNFRRLLVNRLENIDTDSGSTTRYDVQAWYGKTYSRFVLKAEGEVEGSSLEDSKTEILWSRATSKFWDTQLGMRFDNGIGPARSWLALGVQGLAPYWFEVHATAFVGENGRTAIGFEAEYEGRITQRLALKPRIDINYYGKDDPERGIGRGLSDATLGLRLQYQITRQFVPYVGVERIQNFGKTADLLRADINSRDTRWTVGLRFWF